MTRLRLVRAAALVLAVAALAGCRSGVTPIQTLLDDPARYDKKIVRIAGDVEESAGVLGYGAYRVNDGTATIAVVAAGGGAPRTGSKVGVEGEFRSAFTLGSTTGAVIMERERYAP
jgi:hypothetical protein